MKKIIKLLLVSIMCLSCSIPNNLELNSPIDKGLKTYNSFIFIPSGALVKSYHLVEKNIKYTVGISPEHKIIYISTTDKKFSINSLKINDKLPESYFDRKWGYKSGWGYYIEIESGWFAGFDFETKPNKESGIQWFFKFDFNNK